MQRFYWSNYATTTPISRFVAYVSAYKKREITIQTQHYSIISFMKKSLLVVAILALAGNAVAQEAVPVKKHSVATNSFWANWFVQVGANAHMAFSSQEPSGLGVFKPAERGNIGFAVAIGKWFSPEIGLRTKVRAYRSRQVNGDALGWSYNPGISYWNVEEDVMFNFSNLFCGYSDTRVWNFIPYVGIGVARNMSEGGKNYDISYTLGLLNTWKVSKRVNIFADVYAFAVEGSFDAASAAIDHWYGYQKTEMKHWDKQIGVDLGITYNLGKTVGWSKVPDVDAIIAMNKEQLAAMQNALTDAQNENARLRDLLANQPKVTATNAAETKYVTNTKKEFVATPSSVFFNINSSKIASRKDLVSVKEIAEAAKNNSEAKVVVTGYADSKTGSADYNQKLSEARANAVAEELVKMGVERDRIEVQANGGVDTLAPFTYNRRATVVLK